MRWRAYGFAASAGAAISLGVQSAADGHWQGAVAVGAGVWALAALLVPVPAERRVLLAPPGRCGCGDPDCRRGCAS